MPVSYVVLGTPKSPRKGVRSIITPLTGFTPYIGFGQLSYMGSLGYFPDSNGGVPGLIGKVSESSFIIESELPKTPCGC
jgi:hypothetical protein